MALSPAMAGQEPQAVEGPEVVVDLPWGSGGWYAGGFDPNEAAGRGPMSFTVAASGNVFILDQVNFRVLEFAADGSPLRETAIPGETFEDLEVTDAGDILLLDRTVRSAVVAVGPDGHEWAGWDIEGPGIAEGGLVTAMLWRADGLWLEYDHAWSVHFLDTGLLPGSREIVAGRLLPGGQEAAAAALDGPDSARVWLVDRASGLRLREKTLMFDHGLYRIAWLEADGHGRIYGFFHLVDRDAQTDLPVFEQDAAAILGPDLSRIGGFSSPYTLTAREQFREFKVAPDGTMFQMAFTDQGVRILRWRRP